MELYEKLGLKESLLIQIINIFSQYDHIEKVVIFGSRAKGNFKYNSDIDLAIYSTNLSQEELNSIEDKVSMVNTALDFDIIHLQKLNKQKLLENIQRDGVEIYVRR